MSEAVVRESKEEIGIEVVLAEELLILHGYYRETERPYYTGYFKILEYKGEPRIMEPEKIAQLKWFPIDQLPEELIDDRRVALSEILAGGHYAEYGWSDRD